MKTEWTPQEVYQQLSEWIEKHNQEKNIVAYISKKETKEMLRHSQRKMFRWLFSEISKHLWEDPEDIKQNFLKWLFWTRKVKLWKLEFENAIKPTTSELTKEEAIFFINSIIKFIEKYWVPCKYTSLDFKNLIETYERTL